MAKKTKAAAAVAEAPPKVDRRAELKKMAAVFNKEYGAPGEPVMMVGSDLRPPHRIATGILSLDWLHGGGHPRRLYSMYWGPENAGKGHPLHTKVLTPSGWFPIGMLHLGYQVIGANGKPTSVTAIHDRGVLPVYRVSFSDKSSVLCDGDHLWQVTTRKNRKWNSSQVLSVTALMERGVLGKNGDPKFSIPMVEPVVYEEEDLPIPPYTLGVLLANGYLEKGVITTNDDHVAQRIWQEWEPIEEKAKGSARRWSIKGIMIRLRELGLDGKKSAEKFIPEVYLRASIQQRVELLQALLDCDGSASQTQGTPRYFTRSPYLAQGVQDLVQGLGGNAVITSAVDADDGKSDYTVSIHLPPQFLPFSTPRKLERFKSHNHIQPTRKITSIELVGEEPVRCIQVEAQDELYVTECHLVTHNTTLALVELACAQRADPDFICLFLDGSGRIDAMLQRAAQIGVDLDRFFAVKTDTLEEAVEILKQLTKRGLIDMVIVDDLAVYASVKAQYKGNYNEQKERSMTDQTVGAQALANAQFISRTKDVIYKKNVCAVFTQQVRANLDQYGGDFTLPGGHAIKHILVLNTLVERGASGLAPTIDSTTAGDQCGFAMKATISKMQLDGAQYTGTRIVTQFVNGYGIELGRDAFRFLEDRGLVKANGAQRVIDGQVAELMGLPTGKLTFLGRRACEAFLADNYQPIYRHFVPNLALQVRPDEQELAGERKVSSEDVKEAQEEAQDLLSDPNYEPEADPYTGGQEEE